MSCVISTLKHDEPEQQVYSQRLNNFEANVSLTSPKLCAIVVSMCVNKYADLFKQTKKQCRQQQQFIGV